MGRNYVGVRENNFHPKFDDFTHEVREITNESIALLKATSLAELKKLAREAIPIKFQDQMNRFDTAFEEYVTEAKRFISAEFQEFIDGCVDEYAAIHGLDEDLAEIMYFHLKPMLDTPENNIYEQLEINRLELTRQVIHDRIEDQKR